MPGAAFSIAASDCLLALAAEVPGTVRLRLGVSRPPGLTRGSVRTMLGMNDGKVRVRRGGAIAALPAGSLSHDFDFGGGLCRAVAVSWPDVLTGPAVADLETYAEADIGGRAVLRASGLAAAVGTGLAASAGARWRDAAGAMVGNAVAAIYPSAPDPAPAKGFVLVAEAVDRWRRATTLRMCTGDGHAVTTLVADAAVRRVLGGERSAGFTTPARRFGPRFILDLGCAELDPPSR
jgi:short subunit dehydrogenase-like uncharacterized protein